MMERTKKHRRSALWASGVMIVLLASLLPAWAADVNIASPVFDRGVVFKDNGNVRPLGRVFEHVPLDKMPGYGFRWGGLAVRHASGGLFVAAALVDSHIFLTGSVRQHQTTFPGPLRVDRGSGTTIASFDAQGNLYVHNVVEHVTSCVAPVWEGQKWNAYGAITENNNCYNYANNQLTYTYA